MKVTVDKDECSGCALCEETCPEVFSMNDEDIAVVKAGDIAAELEEKVKLAAEDCPSEAIKVE